MAKVQENKGLELSKALRESGVYPGPTVFDFLRKKGFTPDNMLARGGWANILLDMVPDEYQTIGELVETIKAQGGLNHNGRRRES